MKQFFESIYYHPKPYHYPLIFILLPLSLLYGTVMLVRRLTTKKKDFGIPIVSVGNLIVGGSGKTPFVIALASKYENVTIISRGYGRKSRGLIEVSKKGEIIVSVEESGDEAMLMAKSLPNASVIVSEERESAIEFAKINGASLIIMDDGFSRVAIEKFEVLLEPKYVPNTFPFPAGPFREFQFTKRYADLLLKEGVDFKRVVTIEHPTKKMLLATAIANPKRLEPYLPEGVVDRFYLEDHAYFDLSFLEKKMMEVGVESLLVTEKDAVKMENFKLPVSQMRLKLEIKKESIVKISEYIKKYKQGKTG